MNIAFILDTSYSMSAITEKGLQLFDIAKATIEAFINIRLRISEGDDKFHLFSTDTSRMCISSWPHTLDYLITSLKNLKPTKYLHYCRSQTSISHSLKLALDTLNSYRMALSADMNCFGLYSSKSMPSIIIIVTDGEKMSCDGSVITNPNAEMSQLKNRNEMFKELFHWDQSLTSIFIYPSLNGDSKMLQFYEKCASMFGGCCMEVNTFDDIKNKVVPYASYIYPKFQFKYSIPGSKPLESYLYIMPQPQKLKNINNKQSHGYKHLHSNEQNRKHSYIEWWPIPFDQSTIIKQFPSKSVIEVTVEEPVPYLVPNDFVYDSYDVYSPQLKDYISNAYSNDCMLPIEINSVPFALIKYTASTSQLEFNVYCWNFPVLFQILNNPNENVMLYAGVERHLNVHGETAILL